MLSAPIQLNQPIYVHTQAISATINCSESMSNDKTNEIKMLPKQRQTVSANEVEPRL